MEQSQELPQKQLPEEAKVEDLNQDIKTDLQPKEEEKKEEEEEQEQEEDQELIEGFCLIDTIQALSQQNFKKLIQKHSKIKFKISQIDKTYMEPICQVIPRRIKVIHFYSVKLSSESMAEFTNWLQTRSRLNKLVFEYMNFGKVGNIDQLFKTLPLLKYLKELSLISCEIPGQEYVRLFQNIRQGGKLEVLDLSSSKMTSPFYKEFNYEQDQALPLHTLKTLIINGFKMNQKYFVEKFFYYVVCSNAIERVYLNSISTPKDTLPFFWSMVAPCSDDKNPRLQEPAHQLKEIRFSKLSPHIDDEFQDQKVYLIEEFPQYFQKNTEIEVLDLSINKCSPACLRKIADALQNKQQIQELYMDDVGMSDGVGEKILNSLLKAHQDRLQLQILSFKRNKLADKFLKAMAKIIDTCRYIRIVNIGQNRFTQIEDGLQQFGNKVRDSLTLEELRMDHSLMGDKELLDFSDGNISENYSLKVLELQKNHFSQEAICKFLKSELSTNKSLEICYLEKQSPQENEDRNDISHYFALAECLKSNMYLKEINLMRARAKKPKEDLVNALSSAVDQNVFIQCFEQGFIQTEQVQELTNKLIINRYIDLNLRPAMNKRNQTFTLTKENKLEPDKFIEPVIKCVQVLNFQKLVLVRCKLKDWHIQQIAEQIIAPENTRLTHLNLFENDFSEVGLDYLAFSLRENKTLKSLNLGLPANLKTDRQLEDFKEFLETIEHYNLYLQQLNLDTEYHIVQKVLMKEVRKNRMLQTKLKYERAKKHLCYINFDDIDHQALVKSVPKDNWPTFFQAAVKAWRIEDVQKLEIVNSSLSDNEIYELKEGFLKVTQNLQVLKLSNNKISCEGATHIAEIIEKNFEAFDHLDLAKNNIKEIGGKALVAAMKKNTFITTCIVSFGNQLLPDQDLALQQETESNKNIEKLFKDNMKTDKYAQKRYQMQGQKSRIVSQEINMNDKGSNMLHSCLKAVQMLDIRELNFQNNLCGWQGSEKIRDCLRSNPPLVSLNLSQNNLDEYSGIQIGKALGYNTSLVYLDLSNNKLRNEGVQAVLNPIARQKFAVMNGITSSKLKMKIKKLRINNNLHNSEIFKFVRAIMIASSDILIDLDKEDIKTEENEQKDIQRIVEDFKYLETDLEMQEYDFEKIQTEKEKKLNLNLGRFDDLDIQEKISNSPLNSPKRKGILTITPLNFSSQSQNQVIEKENKEDEEEEKDKEEAPEELKEGLTSTIQKKSQDIIKEAQRVYCIRKALEFRADMKEARKFKCSKKLLQEQEYGLQSVITAAVYVLIFFYYFVIFYASSTPLECGRGHPYSAYYIYAGYACISTLSEYCLLKLVVGYLSKGENEETQKHMKLRRFNYIKLMGGQLARADLFTDLLFIQDLWSCQEIQLFYPSTTIVFLSQIYPIFMIFKLMFRNKKHLLNGMERNCQLCYCAEFQALAMYLDSFSLFNYQSFSAISIPVPKIIAVLKCIAEDLPQFIIQMIYISRTVGENTYVIWFYISLGLASFGISMFTAITAQSSKIDEKSVLEDIKVRKAALDDSFENIFEDGGFEQSDEEDDDLNSMKQLQFEPVQAVPKSMPALRNSPRKTEKKSLFDMKKSKTSRSSHSNNSSFMQDLNMSKRALVLNEGQSYKVQDEAFQRPERKIKSNLKQRSVTEKSGFMS